MDTTMQARRRIGGRATLALVLLVGVLTAFGWWSQRPAAGSPLTYTIRTQYATGTAMCGGERTTSATIGVPTAIDLGGSALPDALVTVVAVPASAVGGSDVIRMIVANLSVTPYKGLIEGILAPGSGPGRVAIGYDGCESGAPTSFDATATATADRKHIKVDAGMLTIKPSLKVIGSVFDQVGNTRVDPIAVNARLAPVPLGVTAIFDTVGPDSYTATVRHTPPVTAPPPRIDLNYTNVQGAKRTTANAVVDTLRGGLTLRLTPQEISYDATYPMDRVSVVLDQVTPGQRDTHASADLVGVPQQGKLELKSDSHVTFSTPGTVGSATVGFTKSDPGSTPPTLTGLTDQYVVSDIDPQWTATLAKVDGLTFADIDVGDPILVDVAHRAGPLHIRAKVKALSDDSTPVLVTRDVTADVLDAPATSKVTFSPSTQTFTYDGAAVIGKLTADVTSSVPFVGEANASHLLLEGVPTGAHGQLDTDNNLFTATLTNGKLSKVEAYVTSGPVPTLPEGQQGVKVEDHVGSYQAFVRVLGLETATITWAADKQSADVVHDAGVFVLAVTDDEPASKAIDLIVTVTDLPHDSYFEYDPSTARSTVTYHGSDVIGTLQLDLTSADAIVGKSHQAHVTAKGIPTDMTFVLNDDPSVTGDEFAEATLTGGRLGSLKAELCSIGACTGVPDAGPDDPDLAIYHDQAAGFRAVARMAGVAHGKVAWGDPTVVDFDHDANALQIDTILDKFRSVLVTPPPNPDDAPACHPNHPDPDCDPCKGPNPIGDDCDDTQTGPHYVQVPYTLTFSALIEDLPASTHLSYSPTTHAVSYRGSTATGAPTSIGSLTADVDNSRYPLVGRAHSVHVHLTGIAPGVDLTYDFGTTSQSLVIDAVGGQIGHIEVNALSDPRLLGDHPGLSDPLTDGSGRDGFVFWDLDNGDSTRNEPYDDPYVILVRATNFEHLDYALTTTGPVDSYLLEQTTRTVHLVRNGGPDLWVEILKQDPSETGGGNVAGLAGYKYEYLHVAYTAPPNELWFQMQAEKTSGGLRFYARYWGSAVGNYIDAETNVGASSDLINVELGGVDGETNGVPAGSPNHLAIDACVAPTSGGCAPPEAEASGSDDKLSMGVYVSAPVHVKVDKVQGNNQVHVDLDVYGQVEVYKQVDPNGWFGFKITYIWLDTNNTPLDGTVTVYEDQWTGKDRAFSAHVPKGFRTVNRHFGMKVDPPSVERVIDEGYVYCPAGLDLEEDAGVNLENLLCHGAQVDNAIQTDGGPMELAPGQSYDVYLIGEQFGMQACTGTAYGPCDGPRVLVFPEDGDNTANATIDSVTWITGGLLQVRITIPPDTQPDDFALQVVNPVGLNPPDGPNVLHHAFRVT